MAASAPHRIGQPSPLIFHLSAALSAYSQALLAAPRADSPDFPWAEPYTLAAAGLGPDLDQIEVARQIAQRLSAALRGLEIWQAHRYRRRVREPDAIWQEGCSRLIDFGTVPEATDAAGPPVLVVPSLINRSYILDLDHRRSMLRWLAAQGLRPLLLDWGEPGPREAEFDLDAYGANRLFPALRHIQTLTGRSVAVMGYCMGGTLAAGLVARAPNGVAGLVTIGAPWNFAPTDGIAGGFRTLLRTQGTEKWEAQLDGLGKAFGMVPVSLFQMLFALVNPLQAVVKFRKLSQLDPDSVAAQHFVALEDWLADGIPMPVGAARDLLIRWQIDNVTARRRWRFLGGLVDPREITRPALVFCGRGDSIAPPQLAHPLGAAIPDARVLSPHTGHVGMVVGSVARSQVWNPMVDFVSNHAG